MAITLEQLWVVADRIGDLEEFGLRLERPPETWDYWCTPENTLTFASTGGDGVHYGLLQIEGLPASAQPIVMTLPMNDPNNVVVAESLEEFLNLGYHVGWFSLERLVYEPEEAVEYFAGPDPEEWPEHVELLETLRRELKLVHQPLSLKRIAALEAKYQPLLKVNAAP